MLLFGSGAKPQQSQPTIAQGLRVQTSIYGRAIAIVYGVNRVPGNLIWAGDFASQQVSSGSQSSGGKGGISGGGGKGGGGGATETTYSASLMFALCEGPIQNIGKVWANSSVFASMAAAGFGVIQGFYTDVAWSWLVSNHPAEALNYRGIAKVASANLSLGNSPQIPQYSWEVYSTYQFGGGILDADPKVIVNDLFTNTFYALGQIGAPVLDASAATQYSNYCVANGIFLSELIDTADQFSTVINRILAITNSTCVWAAPGVVKLLPYGDKTITGNGVTFTPALTPQYDLTDDDFKPKKGELPVVLMRKNPADCYNQLVVEGVDRSRDYAIAPAEWKDQGAIDLYGFKPTPSVVQEHGITDPAVASIVAQLLGRRGLYVRNNFKFNLPAQCARLEAGDLVTLTDTVLALNRQLVRLTKVDYGDDAAEDLMCEAEEVPVGVAAPAAYGSASSTGYSANFNGTPGSVAAPLIFDGPAMISGTNLEVHAAIAGATNYGGCEVWGSWDQSTYQKLGVFLGRSRYGVTTSALPVAADPDTTNTLGVDLTISQGSLLSGSLDDVDAFRTLCYVDGELISYETAQLTATYKYTLRDRLRRGVYYTPPFKTHASGVPFARLDYPADNIFRYAYNDFTKIGKTIYLKFLSFNQFGASRQSLADVSAYPYVITGPIGTPTMPTPTGLELYGMGSGNSFIGRDAKFVWRDVSSTQAFDIGSEPIGNTQAGSGAAGSGGLDPHFKDYEVRIYALDGSGNLTGSPLRVEHVTTPYYVYTWEKNAEDQLAITGVGNNPIRAFGAAVYQRGVYGQLSPTPARLAVSNPSPVITSFGVGATSQGFDFGFEKPTDTDFAGVRIYASQVSGFTPGASTLAYDGALVEGSITGLIPGVTYYIKYVPYDLFGNGSTSIEYSLSVLTPAFTPDQGGISGSGYVSSLATLVLDANGGGFIDSIYCPTTHLVYATWANHARTAANMVGVDQVTGQVVKTLDLSAYQAIGDNSDGSLTSISMIWSPVTQRIYAMASKSPDSIGVRKHLICINPSTGLVEADIVTGDATYDRWSTGVFNPSTGMLNIFVRSAGGLMKLAIVDPTTNTVISISTVTVIPNTTLTANAAWVSSVKKIYWSAGVNGLFEVDPATNIGANPIATGVSSLAYVPAIDRIFYDDVPSAANVKVLDPTTDLVTNTITGFFQPFILGFVADYGLVFVRSNVTVVAISAAALRSVAATSVPATIGNIRPAWNAAQKKFSIPRAPGIAGIINLDTYAI